MRTYQYAHRVAPEIFGMPFEEAKDAVLGAHGGDRHSEEFKEQQLLALGGDRRSQESQACNTNLKPLSKNTNAAYIRARLKRDGKTELLDRIESGEISAHAAAVEAGIRQRMIQHPATVEGFARSLPHGPAA